MQKHKIGVHVSAQQRDNYGIAAPHIVSVCAFDAGAFDEVPAECIKIFRTHAVDNHKDAPGDFDKLRDDQLKAVAKWWWDEHLEPIYRKIKAQYGDDVYFQPTNEINNRRILLYLDGMIEAADRDGYKLALLGDAGDSPQINEWVTYWLPWLKKHDGKGHIYSRHAYSGVNPDDGTGKPSVYLTKVVDGKIYATDNNTNRPFIEAKFMRDEGISMPMVITELGWLAGWNNVPDGWLPDLLRYNKLMMEHDNIMGSCLWNAGQWETAPNILSGRPLLELGNQLKTMTPVFYDPNKPVVVPEPEPKMSFNEWVWSRVEAQRTQRFNAAAGLENQIISDGLVMTGNEEWNDDEAHGHWAIQGAIDLNSREEWVYVVPVGLWDEIQRIPKDEPKPEPDTEQFEFEFEYWPTQHKVITQTYGNNPKYYSQFGLDGHEGLDFRAPHGSPIVAPADGIIKFTGSERKPEREGGHNYGVRVRIVHAKGYETYHAHLDRFVVTAGEKVKAGQIIGFADDTGNSFGSHLHLNLYKDGLRIDPTPYFPLSLPIADVKPQPDPIPPPQGSGKLFDLLEYFLGAEGYQYMVKTYKPAHKFGQQERFRIDHYPKEKIFYIVKNAQWEKYHYDDNWIYQDTDTSPGSDEYYKVRDRKGGSQLARRCPRFMRVGQYWEDSRQHYVEFFNKRTGQNSGSSSEGWGTNKAHFKLAGKWTSREGIQYADTITVRMGVEDQTLAKGIGPVGWVMEDGETKETSITPEDVSNQMPYAREMIK